MENCFHDIKSVYVQCDLARKHRCGGTVTETAFIPKQLAHKGANLRIRINGKWEEGWVVTFVGSERVGVPDVQRTIRVHRKHTGDSLPKRPPEKIVSDMQEWYR
jgi:hypothetical protein